MSFIPQFNEGPYSQLSSAAETIGFPPILDFEGSYRLLNQMGDSQILLGVDGNGNPITVDLDSDSPHILVSASSGGGKSVIARSATAQVLAHNGVATILDLKRHSHRWAKNLPNVGYAQTLAEIGNALVEIGKEVHRRNKIVDEWPGTIESAPVGHRLLVVFEEMNATMEQLRRMTKHLPQGEYDALDAFGDIMFMGRAAKVHVLGVAQWADARTMGGSSFRENFTTRILINYSKQSWTMLAYDCGLPQAAPSKVGRGMTCAGGKARQTQFLYLTEEEAAALGRHAYALAQPMSVPQIGARNNA